MHNGSFLSTLYINHTYIQIKRGIYVRIDTHVGVMQVSSAWKIGTKLGVPGYISLFKDLTMLYIQALL